MTGGSDTPFVGFSGQDFGNKLVLFQDIDPGTALYPLNDRLLLISEHEKESHFVFGYVINAPMRERLYSFLQQRNAPYVPDALRFKEIFEGAADGYEGYDGLHQQDTITFITRNEQPTGSINEYLFGDFATYSCETPEEALEVINMLGQRESIAVARIFQIDETLLDIALHAGQARIRDADPDIVFTPSAYMRTVLAFPPPGGPS